jgi:nucleoid-associated protein YgaU
MIGLKIADGTFIPILDESEKDKKKVILTTVRDDQPTVQIDLYKGTGSGMEDPKYLDTLKFDKIEEALKGEPEIELVIAVDDEDESKLLATVRDLKGVSEKSFVVSLEGGSDPSFASDSDFELSSSEDTPRSEETVPSYSPLNGHSASIHEEKNRKPLLLLALLALLIAAGVLCWYFLFRDKGEDAVAQPVTPPPAVVQPAPAQPTPPAPKPATPAPAPEAKPAPVQPAAPAPAVTPKPAEPKTPAPAAQSSGTGVWYSVVKGDNLWNLSKSFYRNPWLYQKIAKENKIRNPDLILRGARIYIPDVETDRNKK